MDFNNKKDPKFEDVKIIYDDLDIVLRVFLSSIAFSYIVFLICMDFNNKKDPKFDFLHSIINVTINLI